MFSLYAQQSVFKWYEISDNEEETIRALVISESDYRINDEKIIHHYYDSLGYFEHNIAGLKDSLIVVKTGRQYRYEFDITYTDSVKSELTGLRIWKQAYESGLYDAGVIRDGLADLRSLFLNNGYAAVSIRLKEPQLDSLEKKVVLPLQLETGAQLTREHLVFSGLETTSEIYAGRITSLRKQDVLDRRNLNAARKNLLQSGLFSSVSDPTVIRLQDTLRVLFNVEEQNPNQFDLVLGYVPNSSGDNEIVGEGELNLKEVFAEGVYLDLTFSRMQQNRNSLGIAAGKKWWFGLPLSLNGQFDIYQRDSTFQSRDINAGVGYALSSTTSIEGFFTFEERTRGIATEIENQNDTEALLSGVRLTYDTRDNVIAPLSGVNFSLSAQAGQLTNLNLPDSSIMDKVESRQRLKIQSRLYWNPAGRHVLSPRLHGGIVLADSHQLGDLFRFGGTQSLRGYREEQFEASTFIWGDAEYRFLLDRSTYLFTFAATGWYDNEIQNTEKFISSYGLGLAYNTPIGLVSFTYAKSPDDPFNNAKIHFGIRGRL